MVAAQGQPGFFECLFSNIAQGPSRFLMSDDFELRPDRRWVHSSSSLPPACSCGVCRGWRGAENLARAQGRTAPLLVSSLLRRG